MAGSCTTPKRCRTLVLTSVPQDLLHVHLSSSVMALLLLLLSALGRERELAREALGTRERILRAITENTPANMFVKDAAGRYLSVNPSMARRCRRPEHEIVGKTDLDLMPEAVATKLREQDQEVLRLGHPAEFEEEISLDGVETRTYLALKVPLYDDDGRPWAVCGVATDITDRKRLERELIQARRAAEAADVTKAEFLSVMSHELRTPLNAIIGFAEMMEHETFGALGCAKYVDYSAHIRESGQHLLGVISDVLDMSRLESGKVTLHPEKREQPSNTRRIILV